MNTRVLAVYLAAFLQGLALVSFPASGTVLKGTLGLSDAQYGSIFLPQVALAVIGAFGGASFAQRLGLKALLIVSLIALALSQFALAGSLAVPETARYVTVCAGTALLGFGFGLGGAPLNGFAAQFFPQKRDTALVALHSLIGLGLAAGPLVLGAVMSTAWLAFPLGLAALALMLALWTAALALPRPDSPGSTAQSSVSQSPAASPVFWLLAVIAVLYAFAEGTFGNWTIVYLSEVKQLPVATASLALSMFWVAMVGGRLLASALVLRVPARVIWLTLPALMIAAFLLLPHVTTPASGIAYFALAGLACSAFFPLTIALACERFPQHVAWVSSMMIAALMLGVGVGSFVLGTLRGWLSMEQLYQISVIYPAAALGLGLLLRRPSLAQNGPPPHT